MENVGILRVVPAIRGSLGRVCHKGRLGRERWRGVSEMERQRDAALIGYNECRATIEDARRALGATAHEGLLLAAMRVTEQCDTLAEALRELCETLLNDKPRDITESLYKAGDALAAWKGWKP